MSRRQKNHILIGVNALAILVKLLKKYLFNLELSQEESIWFFFALFAIVFNGLPKMNKAYDVLKHAVLFLSTGAIIGITIGAMLNPYQHVIVLEYIWLVFGVLGATLHYSPSKRDVYRN
ncbi:MAG: hypothetical protein AAFO99_10535 [Bacteroidota bacterium]